MDPDHSTELERAGPASSAAGGRAGAAEGAAQRALAEAEARRAGRKLADQVPRPREVNGRQGPEPVRYGDWENKGIASDF
jgi:hypothetical protein